MSPRSLGQNRHRLIRNFALLLASVFVVTAAAAISPALPAMQEAFAAVPGVGLLVPLVLTAPALSVAVAAPLSGAAMDRWGRRPILVASLVTVGLAGSAGYVLPSLQAIILSRVILGLGVAGSITAATVLISDLLAGHERDRYLGYQSAVIWLSGTAFSQVGGLLADHHWRQPFLLFLTALAVVPLVLLYVPEPARSAAPASGGPTTVATPSMTRPWAALALPYLVGFLRTVAFFVIVVQLPFHLEAHFGASGAQIGAALAVMNLCAGLTGLVYGRLTVRFGLLPLFAGIFLTMALGHVALGLASSWPVLLVGLVGAGTSNGIVVPHLTLWLIRNTPASTRGRAVGGLNTAIHLGQFASPILVAPIITRISFPGAYLASAALLAAIGLMFIRFRSSRAH